MKLNSTFDESTSKSDSLPVTHPPKVVSSLVQFKTGVYW